MLAIGEGVDSVGGPAMSKPSRVSLAEAAEIRRLRAEGLTQGAIALRVKRARATVQDVLKGHRTRRPDRSKKAAGGVCCECGRRRGPFFGKGKFERCVICAALAAARAKGRRV